MSLVFFVAMLMVCCLCFGMVVMKDPQTDLPPYKSWRREYLVLIPVLGFFAGALSPLYTESGAPNEPVIQFDDAGRVLHATELIVLCYDNCSSAPKQLHLASHVSPITDNPKVRDIGYEIRVEVTDWQKFFETIGYKHTFDAARKNRKIIEDRVRFVLYEFNNRHSKDVAAFYNPLDHNQHAAFELLLRDFVNSQEMLGQNGIKMIELESFSIDDPSVWLRTQSSRQ